MHTSRNKSVLEIILLSFLISGLTIFVGLFFLYFLPSAVLTDEKSTIAKLLLSPFSPINIVNYFPGFLTEIFFEKANPHSPLPLFIGHWIQGLLLSIAFLFWLRKKSLNKV